MHTHTRSLQKPCMFAFRKQRNKGQKLTITASEKCIFHPYLLMSSLHTQPAPCFCSINIHTIFFPRDPRCFWLWRPRPKIQWFTVILFTFPVRSLTLPGCIAPFRCGRKNNLPPKGSFGPTASIVSELSKMFYISLSLSLPPSIPPSLPPSLPSLLRLTMFQFFLGSSRT